MPEVIVKTKQVEPGSQTNPTAPDIVDWANKRAKTLKFASDTERRDYEAIVRGNPNNIYGLPRVAMFPPTTIRTTVAMKRDCAKVGHRPSNTQEKFCTECGVDL